jgi:hypothetical protein
MASTWLTAPPGEISVLCVRLRGSGAVSCHILFVCVFVWFPSKMFARVLVLLALLAAVFAAIDEHKVIMCVLVPPVFLLN